MITKEAIQAGASKPTLKTLANGGVGTGKTYYSMTHPSWAYLGIEPDGLAVARSNPHLLDNMIWADEFIPSPTEDIKQVFERLEAAIVKAHAEAKEGKISTLILDNISHLSENRWIYINQHEKQIGRDGTLDTRGMYGTLSRWLYNFTLTRILSFPGHVVVTCHEQTETDEAMEKKTDKTTPIVPQILGGFREKVATLFSASIYMEKKRLGPGKYQYLARCQRGNQRDAKNRYNLPEVVENVSYDAIMAAIKAANVTTPKPVVPTTQGVPVVPIKSPATPIRT